MDKQIVGHSYSGNDGIIFSHEKEQTTDLLNKIDESLKCYAMQNKPDTNQ